MLHNIRLLYNYFLTGKKVGNVLFVRKLICLVIAHSVLYFDDVKYARERVLCGFITSIVKHACVNVY